MTRAGFHLHLGSVYENLETGEVSSECDFTSTEYLYMKPNSCYSVSTEPESGFNPSITYAAIHRAATVVG